MENNFCKNGNHVDFRPAHRYMGGICEECGNPITTPVLECKCGAEVHKVQITNDVCDCRAFSLFYRIIMEEK